MTRHQHANGDPRVWSLGRAMTRPFQVWVCVVAMVNAVAFWFRPGVSPINDLADPWPAIWTVIYGLAGLLMLVGIARRDSAHIEALGLCLLLAGLLIQVIVFAALGVGSLTGTAGTIITLSTLGGCAGWRLVALLRASAWLKDER